jgi:hypothetical protein
MADSYRNLLWAAAYLINGGCSDDGFESFRCWLIVQGRTVFERSVADPDTLADLPVIQAAGLVRRVSSVRPCGISPWRRTGRRPVSDSRRTRSRLGTWSWTPTGTTSTTGPRCSGGSLA